MKRFTKMFLTLALLCVAGSVSAQEQVHATFASPSNTNTTWTADASGETLGTFTWSTTYYNQLRNIGLPNGDISKYKKLVVDCKMVEGTQFRVLFYKGDSNKTLYAKDGVNEFIIKDELEKLGSDYNEFILQCSEICLSGDNGAAPGKAIINDVYLETYPEGEGGEIPDIEYEEDPGKPEGEFIDFTTVFPSLQPKIGLGEDEHPIVLGNGGVVVGARSKDVIADLSAYSKLTMVTSPNLKVVLYMNHEVDAQQNAGDYAEGDAGKYVFMDVQADENGLIEVDLTQFAKQDLNCICLPWDNSNKGTVWYLLLTENEDPLAFAKNELSKAIDQGKAVKAFGKTEDSFSALTSAISAGEGALESATSAEALENAKQAIENAISGLTIADGYIALTKEMFKKWTAADATAEESGTPGFESHLGEGVNAGATLYGDGSVFWHSFADLSDYGMIYFVGNPGVQVRCLFNRAEDPENKGALVEKVITVNEEGVAEFDLTTLTEGYAHLNSVKIPWNGSTGNIITDILLTELTTVPVTITDAGYATFSSKKAVALETGMEAYAVEYTGSSAKLIPVEGAVDANTPVILKAEKGDYDLNIVESGAAPEKNDLLVSDGNVAGNGSIYVLANGGSGVGFYKLAEGVKIPAGKAYLEVNANGREFIGFGDATAIKNIETVKADGAIYNLAGQQVKSAQKGVFIVNGKKAVVK